MVVHNPSFPRLLIKKVKSFFIVAVTAHTFQSRNFFKYFFLREQKIVITEYILPKSQTVPD